MSAWFLFFVLFMYMIVQGVLFFILLIKVQEIKNNQLTRDDILELLRQQR